MFKLIRRYRPKRWRVLVRRYTTIDNVLDFLIDVALVLFDTLSQPILIPIRIGKVFLKRVVKSVAKWVRQRSSA